MKRIRARLEINPRHWLGLYVQREYGVVHVYLTLLPCLPLHLALGTDRRVAGQVRSLSARQAVSLFAPRAR